MTDRLMVVAAVAVGLPTALAEHGDATAGELAAQLGLVPRRLRALLCALHSTGTVSRRLSEGRELFALGAVPFPREPGTKRGAALCAAVLRRAEPIGWLEAAGNPEAAALTCSEELTATGVAAVDVARLVAPALAEGGVFVDAGCGGGELTEAVLAAAPLATAVACDLPAVLPLAAQRLAARGRRVRFVPGDLREVALPPCRAVILANVLHVLDDETAQRVVTRLGALIEPGGRMVVKEVLLDEDGGGPPVALRFALSLALHGGGEVRPPSTMEAWLQAAGFSVVHRAPLDHAADAVGIVGVRRA